MTESTTPKRKPFAPRERKPTGLADTIAQIAARVSGARTSSAAGRIVSTAKHGSFVASPAFDRAQRLERTTEGIRELSAGLDSHEIGKTEAVARVAELQAQLLPGDFQSAERTLLALSAALNGVQIPGGFRSVPDAVSALRVALAVELDFAVAGAYAACERAPSGLEREAVAGQKLGEGLRLASEG